MKEFHCQYQGLCYSVLCTSYKITLIFSFLSWAERQRKNGYEISGFSIVMVALQIYVFHKNVFCWLFYCLWGCAAFSTFFPSLFSNVLLLTLHKTFLHNIKLNDFCCASYSTRYVSSLQRHPMISYMERQPSSTLTRRSQSNIHSARLRHIRTYEHVDTSVYMCCTNRLLHIFTWNWL